MNYQEEIAKIKSLEHQLIEMKKYATAKVEELLHENGDYIVFANKIGERWFDNMTKIEWRKFHKGSSCESPVITFCNIGERTLMDISTINLYKLLSLIEKNI